MSPPLCSRIGGIDNSKRHALLVLEQVLFHSWGRISSLSSEGSCVLKSYSVSAASTEPAGFTVLWSVRPTVLGTDEGVGRGRSNNRDLNQMIFPKLGFSSLSQLSHCEGYRRTFSAAMRMSTSFTVFLPSWLVKSRASLDILRATSSNMC